MTPDEAFVILEQLEDYFDNRADADDGQPNQEMKLLTSVRELLTWVEKMP